MADTLSPEQRRLCMSRVRSVDTSPELGVRRLAFGLGYRFRLHRRDLPGCPDLVFPARKRVIFVHGCFWHGHACKRGRVRPKNNAQFWQAKLDGNAARDRRATAKLRRAGWRVLQVWECQVKDVERLTARLKLFLGAVSRRKGS